MSKKTERLIERYTVKRGVSESRPNSVDVTITEGSLKGAQARFIMTKPDSAYFSQILRPLKVAGE